MKLSEMTNDMAAEAMIRMSVPLSNICEDEEATKILDEWANAKDMNAMEAIGKLLPKAITYAFAKHRQDLYEIIGALTNTDTQAVAKMNFKATIQAVRDSYDDILASFFPSSGSLKPGNGEQ